MENNKIKLLLVEDERMLAEILADTLSDRGFDVTLAADGEEALSLWRELRPDIVVSDVMMPKMDGFTLVKRMRAEGCRAPVLFLTARSATEDVVKGFSVGGAGVSTKHAGFVVNNGGATAADVKEVLRQVAEKVYENTGIRLEPEVRIW